MLPVKIIHDHSYVAYNFIFWKDSVIYSLLGFPALLWSKNVQCIILKNPENLEILHTSLHFSDVNFSGLSKNGFVLMDDNAFDTGQIQLKSIL